MAHSLLDTGMYGAAPAMLDSMTSQHSGASQGDKISPAACPALARHRQSSTVDIGPCLSGGFLIRGPDQLSTQDTALAKRNEVGSH